MKKKKKKKKKNLDVSLLTVKTRPSKNMDNPYRNHKVYKSKLALFPACIL